MLKFSRRDLHSGKLSECVASGTERGRANQAVPSDDNGEAGQRISVCLKLKNTDHLLLFIIPLYPVRDKRANTWPA